MSRPNISKVHQLYVFTEHYHFKNATNTQHSLNASPKSQPSLCHKFNTQDRLDRHKSCLVTFPVDGMFVYQVNGTHD